MAETVESANVVGYAKKDCPANTFIQAGAQFFDVATDKLMLDKVMSGLAGVDFDDKFAFMGTAPHIQVVIPGDAPKMYYYLNDGYYVDENNQEQYKAGWCDSDGNIVDLEITPGSGFWLKNAASVAQTMTGAGAVSALDSYDVKAPAGVFSINANVYPVAINLNNDSQVTFPDIVGVNFDDKFAFMGTAPHIQIVIPGEAPKMYYYLNDGYYVDENNQEQYKAGWCDSDGNLVDVDIEAQAGFWVKATTGALTFSYKK